MFKKLTTRAIEDVKKTVVEETGKSADEVKERVKKTAKDVLPYVAIAIGVIVCAAILRRPMPVMVKVVVKQA